MRTIKARHSDTRRLNQVGLALGLGLGLGLCCSCSQSQIRGGSLDAQGASSNVSAKPPAAAVNDQSPAGPPAAAAALPDTKGLLKASFNVTVNIDGSGGFLNVYGLVHAKICSGPISLSLNPSFDKQSTLELIDVSSGMIDCGSLGKIDVSKAMGVLLKPQQGGGIPFKTVNNTLAFSDFSGVKFSPPRPIFPAFLAASADDLKGLNVATDLTVTGADGKSGTGQSILTMRSFNTTYTPPGLGKAIPSTMDFTVATSGFDGVNRSAAMLFDLLEFRLSTKPFALLQIVVSSQSDTLIGTISSVPEAATSGLISTITPIIKNVEQPGFGADLLNMNLKNFKITITLDLTSQEGLDQALVAAAGLGEVYGSNPTGGG